VIDGSFGSTAPLAELAKRFRFAPQSRPKPSQIETQQQIQLFEYLGGADQQTDAKPLRLRSRVAEKRAFCAA
jgi:hypothetical protein